jgi:hypothetical protein
VYAKKENLSPRLLRQYENVEVLLPKPEVLTLSRGAQLG